MISTRDCENGKYGDLRVVSKVYVLERNVALNYIFPKSEGVMPKSDVCNLTSFLFDNF